ncbi:CFEM domain-containing [Fusarium albosuccineum]|uniref:CFEM domain-containing n=1 Tax=Fusarium albosuccineum TaxID=1237068 RepID=A0A8H4L738_9HYPO|nr:CFEM domain-containing [Fusarium albosuccineum]
MGEEVHAQPSIGLNPRSVPLDELPTNPLQQRLIVINFLVTALAFLFWVLRIYSKHTAKQLGIDDWLMAAAMAFSIGLAPVTYLCLVKASALVFLHRLGGHSRRISLTIQGLGVLNLALMIAVFLTVIFQTTPINAYWDLTVERKRQIDGPAFYVTSAIITIVTDVLVLIIPFPLILGLRMRVATKVGILVVLLLGGVVTVVGIVRVYIFHRTFYDSSYDASNSLNNCLSAVEVNLAIMAASGPAFRLLLGGVFPGLFTTHAGTSAEIPSSYGGAPRV